MMPGVMQRMLVLGFGGLLCAQVVRAESFVQIVVAYGGAAALVFIFLAVCSVLVDWSEGGALEVMT